MPAVIGVEVIAAIALAFAAISATLLVRQLVVGPIRASASGVSSIAVIGGALAWLLVNAANMIDLGLNVFDWGQAQFRAQALSWWNYAVSQTAYYIGLPQRWEFNQVAGNAASALSTTQYIWGAYLPRLATRVTVNERDTQAVTALAQFIWYASLPELHGIDAGLRADVNAVTRLAQQIWYNDLPAIRGIEQGIRTDLGALGQTVGRQASALASTTAIAAAAATAITAIENSPCLKVCEPLGEVGSLLQGLEDAGMLAILLGLIDEARRDPAAVHEGLRNIAAPIVNDAVSSLRLGI